MRVDGYGSVLEGHTSEGRLRMRGVTHVLFLDVRCVLAATLILGGES